MRPACIAAKASFSRELLALAALSIMLRYYTGEVISLKPPAVRRAFRAVCGWHGDDFRRLRVVMAALRQTLKRYGVLSLDGGRTLYRRQDLLRLRAVLIGVKHTTSSQHVS